jgi:hypothetical protein
MKLVAVDRIYTVDVHRPEGVYEVVVTVRTASDKCSVRSILRYGPRSFWQFFFNTNDLPDDVRKEAEFKIFGNL